MIKHSFGVEFNIGGFEFAEGSPTGSSDPYYAGLVAKVLKTAMAEDFMLDVISDEDTPGDTPLIGRMQELAGSRRRSALLHDNEVPAVLGMFKIALDRMFDKDRDRTVEDSFSSLPPGTMEILVNSLEVYENQRASQTTLSL